MELQAFDADYIARLTRNDAATEQHFTAYFRELLLLKLRARLRSRQSIDDVIQETFVRVIATLRRKGLASPESLGAFVNSVCNNVLHECVRSEGRSAPIEDAAEPAAPVPDMESRLLSDERQRLVGRILRDLPERDHSLLKDVFLEERDKDLVCAEYGVDRDYLRVLLHRAVERARRLMREQYFPVGA